MITKKDVMCVKPLKKGPFFREFMVCLSNVGAKQCFLKLRAMQKRRIVKDTLDENMVMYELLVRTNLRHPFLINQIGAFQDYDNLFYLTEHTPVPLLDNPVLPHVFSTAMIRFYAAEIISCFRYLHSKNHVFVFLSPSNLFIGYDGHVKLDYPFCNSLNETPNELEKYVEYLSPNYLVNHRFTEVNDFWSLGIVLFKMAAGYTPFESGTPDKTAAAVLRGDLEFPSWIDKDLCEIIKILLDPGILMGNLFETYELIRTHAFFIGVEWDQVDSKKLAPPYIPKKQNLDLRNKPLLESLYTSDFIVGDKDGYGTTFSGYHTVTFIKK